MLCALPDTANLPDKETREKTKQNQKPEEPKAPLKISENMMIDFWCSLMERMQQHLNIWQSNVSDN